MPWDCNARGHCQHEADGSLFQRYDRGESVTVAVTCCRCGQAGEVEGHSPHGRKRGLDQQTQEHGPFRP